MAVTIGIGFTVISTITEDPEQLFAVGIIVYVAVPVTDPVVDSVWAIVVPVPADAPETPNSTTVQEKVDDDPLLVKAIDGATPEQIVCVEEVAVATGIGLTVIRTFIGVPIQPLAVGVIE